MTQQIHFLPPIRDNEFLPPISRWTQIGGLVLVGIMGIGMTLSAVTHYKMTVKAQATIRPAGELRLVQAATEGAVMQVLVKENQVVKRGEAIATIDDARLQTKKSELQSTRQQAQLQFVQINAQISTLNRQIAAETNRVDRSVAAAQAERSQRDRDYQERQVTTAADLEEAEATVKQAIATLQAAQTKQRRYQEVAQAGALSRDQLEEVKLAVQQQEQAVAAAKAKRQRTEAALNPSHAEVVMATERIAQEQASGQANLAALAKEREALVQQRIEIDKQLKQTNHELQQIKLDLRQTTIAATADGIVANLHLRNPGQTVRVGESIAEIVPSDASLEVKAAVSPQDRSKLKPGQRVQMRVSACPYPDYGVLNGRVSRISEDTVKPPANAAAPDAEQSRTAPAFYEVTIAPERRSLGHRQHQCVIQSGMEGRVDIIAREETVLTFLLRKARLMADL
nr:HlyD family efflux transporter periplasmic adaptor subunit [Nostoc sp. DedSLP05]MDZ8100854.1 HlyD family efflux transporter periplasmic adaptor subunit [Nostoc sp. DedSLP01]